MLIKGYENLHINGQGTDLPAHCSFSGANFRLEFVLPVDCSVCLVPLFSIDGTREKSKGFCACMGNRYD